MGTGRTLHVRCSTWEQVEVFHTRKLRGGKLLSMKVPFETEIGAQVTLGLELPNQVVMAIDGVISKASPIAGDSKTWIEVELAGFTEELVARLKAMAEGDAAPVAPAPEPVPAPRPSVTRLDEDLPSDERELFQRLSAELRRLRQLAVHEVLAIERDADPEVVRRGWMNLVRRHHPDLVARHRAPAITHLAEELTILANRAYDRQRAALVAEGRATAIGSALKPPAGWLVGFDDIDSRVQPQTTGPLDAVGPVVVKIVEKPKPAPAPDVVDPSLQGGEAFESRARAMLADGDSGHAQEVLAAALCVYPRSRTLRSLYYVAAAMTALQGGEVMLATSQLETALAHFEQCREAAQILDHVRRHGGHKLDDLGRLFREAKA